MEMGAGASPGPGSAAGGPAPSLPRSEGRGIPINLYLSSLKYLAFSCSCSDRSCISAENRTLDCHFHQCQALNCTKTLIAFVKLATSGQTNVVKYVSLRTFIFMVINASPNDEIEQFYEPITKFQSSLFLSTLVNRQ